MKLHDAVMVLAKELNRAHTSVCIQGKALCWSISGEFYQYLDNAQSPLGLYIWRKELMQGTLMGYPFKIASDQRKNASLLPMKLSDAHLPGVTAMCLREAIRESFSELLRMI